ncbi:MAG: 3-dehydroquinate synthase [Candidatus Xiphinematobacter sp.]|nr:MAG: 3-dehydroquinate synthase [Candidatus Xiphinematobacter sp.]
MSMPIMEEILPLDTTLSELVQLKLYRTVTSLAYPPLDLPLFFVVTDSNVAKHHLKPVLASLENVGFQPLTLVIPSGEQSKSFCQVYNLCHSMIIAGLDRKSVLFSLGGGVIGDLSGFVAAIFQRGIPLVQLPTTVTSQVDSSVGGKTGVNVSAGKNLIGAFHQPQLVIVDPLTLNTLPNREYWEGFAEIVKHAVIRDTAMLEILPPKRLQDLSTLIVRNIAVKSALVASDERDERGVRALLNFGHTIGHGIETAAGYGSLLHGEAISLGIMAALWLSVRFSGLLQSELEHVAGILRRLSLPIVLPDRIPTECVLTAMRNEKKFEQGKLRFVLTHRLGSAYLSDEVNLQDARHAVEFLRKFI